MQIPLDQFEHYIDETIMKRGLSYFKNGYVHEPEEIKRGVYEAVVEGTENYTVQLTVQQGTVVQHVCDCPYDMGPVCKHVAAVIFYLQQDILGLSVKKKASSATTAPKKKAAKRKTIAEQIDELLENISHDELKQFIREKAQQEKMFRNLFLASFIQYSAIGKKETKELYAKQVKATIGAAKDSDGFIERRGTRYVGKSIGTLLHSAKKHHESKNYHGAILICTAIMEQMVKALQFADDSDGEVSGSITSAYELLTDMAKGELPEDIREEMLRYSLSVCEQGIYSDWDWHLDMLRLAVQLLKTEKETDYMLSLLEKMQKDKRDDGGYTYRYQQEQIQSLIYEILEKGKDKKKAAMYLEQHIANPSLRRIAIANAMKKEDYAEAISIARDGIVHDEKGKPGCVIDWYNWLLKIAQAQKDTENIIKYARQLFVADISEEQDYYQLLKLHIQSAKWNAYVEELLQDITTIKQWRADSLVASIYIKEKWWSRLFEHITKESSLRAIEQYEQYLSADYASELADLYAERIVLYLRANAGRSSYQDACRYLRKMIKLGARDKANAVIAALRAEHPKRRALLEELDKV